MQSLRSQKTAQWILLALALFVLAVYQTIEYGSKLHLMTALRRLEHPESVPYSYEGKDHPVELPLHIPQAAMNAEWPDDNLYGIYEDEEWASLFPRSGGWLTLGPNDDMFVLSMFHQLHCVDVLRYAYASAKSGTLVYPGNGTGVEHHVGHCLTYLKEVVLCRADTTLEETWLIDSKDGFKRHGATGMDMIHRCRDWTKIEEYLDTNFEERLAKGIVDIYGNEI